MLHYLNLLCFKFTGSGVNSTQGPVFIGIQRTSESLMLCCCNEEQRSYDRLETKNEQSSCDSREARCLMSFWLQGWRCLHGHCFRAKVVALFGVLVSSGSNFVHFGIFRCCSCPDSLCSVSLLRSCHDLGLNIPQNLANDSPKKITRSYSFMMQTNNQLWRFKGFPLAVRLLGRNVAIHQSHQISAAEPP